MENLRRSKCINHPEREAVARCPECRHFFCRECVTEHEGRVVCAVCLQHIVAGSGETERSDGIRAGLGKSFLALKVAGGILLLWVVFHAIGQILLSIPADFHSGQIWSDL